MIVFKHFAISKCCVGCREEGDLPVPVQLRVHQRHRGPGRTDSGNHILRSNRPIAVSVRSSGPIAVGQPCSTDTMDQ